MKSLDLSSLGTTDPAELRRVYHYFSSMPIAERNCPDCDGHGFVRNDLGVVRCGCMPPFIVTDAATGTIRHGNLILDGRVDGRHISREEAELRHREGVRIADEAFATVRRMVTSDAPSDQCLDSSNGEAGSGKCDSQG